MNKSVNIKKIFVYSVVLIYSTEMNSENTLFRNNHNRIITEEKHTPNQKSEERSFLDQNFLSQASNSMHETPKSINNSIKNTAGTSNFNESGFVSILACDETLSLSNDSSESNNLVAHSTPFLYKYHKHNRNIHVKTYISHQINFLDTYRYTEATYISRGREGCVYKVFSSIKNKTIALKIFNNEQNNLHSVFDEMIIRRNLNHLYLLNITLVVDRDIIFMEMDFYEFDLFTYTARFDLNQLDRRIILKQVIDGLRHIHSRNVIHNDIKPSNILINQSFDVKIADFGLACFSNRLIYPFEGIESSVEYKTYSPELKNNTIYNDKSDVYAFGALIYYLYHLSHELSPELINKMEDDAKSILVSCINENPDNRMSSKQLKIHYYFDILYSELFCFSKFDNFKFTTDSKISIEKNDKQLTISGENLEYKVYCCCCNETIEKYSQKINKLREHDGKNRPLDYVSKVRYLIVFNNKSKIVQSLLKYQLNEIKNAFLCVSEYLQSTKTQKDIKNSTGKVMRKRKLRSKKFY